MTTTKPDVRTPLHVDDRGSGKTLIQHAMKTFYAGGEGAAETLLPFEVLVIDEVASNPNLMEAFGALVIGPRTDDESWDFAPLDLDSQEG